MTKPEDHLPEGYYGTAYLVTCDRCGVQAWKSIYSDATTHQPYKGGCRGRWLFPSPPAEEPEDA